MLTDSEKKWLEDRRRVAYCRYCNVSTLCANPFASGYTCPLTAGNMKDALEFSERVAAKLAKAFKEYVKRRNCVDFEVGTRCPGWEVCAADHKKRLPCDFAIMKGVQLEVEEEMNG